MTTSGTTLGIRATTLTSFLVIAACGDTGSDDDTSPTTSTSDTPTSTDPTTSTTTPDESSTTDVADSSTSSPETGTGTDTDVADSSTDDGSTDDGSTTAADAIEIAGSWTDGFGNHDITDTAWISTFGRDVFPYTISQYDNDADFAIAQDDGTGTWTRYDWIFLDEELWYCTTAFGLESEDDAVSTPAADATDPASGGCGDFPWSALTPL